MILEEGILTGRLRKRKDILVGCSRPESTLNGQSIGGGLDRQVLPMFLVRQSTSLQCVMEGLWLRF